MGTLPKADNNKKEVGGIKNLGNTCYMGAALQALANVTELSNFLIENVKRLPEIPLVKEYVQMIKTILKLRKQADPKELKVIVSRKSPLFADFAQHDSQEFIQFFVNALHESLMGILRGVAQGVSCDMYRNDGAGAASAAQHDQIWRDAIDHWRNEVLAPKKGSVIFDLFAGQSVSELKCLTEERLRDIPLDKIDICCFMRLFKDKDENGEGDRLICISLAQRFTGEKVYLVDAPDAGQLPFDVPLISINHCLADFVKPENIEGSRCEKCSNATPPPPAPRTLVKQLMFTRLPNILIVCFKRFIYEPFERLYIKQHVPVSFPLDKTARRNRFSASTFFSPAAFHLMLLFNLFCFVCSELLLEAKIKENIHGNSMNLLVGAVAILLAALALGITFSATILPIGRSLWESEAQIKKLNCENIRITNELIQLQREHSALISAYEDFQITVMNELAEN
ncbi:hypothetical protein niasHT_017504 [Heterodera trifolii]|uniref:ubiquitinyl hydrolase 1 n=1 Tax=Heterodera trifolii TaxID=157864 RepID=A0ABD2L624_9BILA